MSNVSYNDIISKIDLQKDDDIITKKELREKLFPLFTNKIDKDIRKLVYTLRDLGVDI